VLAESANIIEYVAEHFGCHLIPERWKDDSKGEVGDETDEWLRDKFYMNYSEGSLMALIATGALKNG
jgi:glutathione S-transferase